MRGIWGLTAVTIAVLCGPGSAGAADRIAYRCQDSNSDDICTIDPGAPGTGTHITPTTAASEGKPTWSPDGTLVAFVGTYPANGGPDVYVTKGDGSSGQATQISGPNNRFESFGPPRWSPDGTRLAWDGDCSCSGPGNPTQFDGIYTGLASGLDVPGQLPGGNPGNFPVWSPDGTRIALQRANALYLAPADGSATAAVLPGSAGGQASWSPDGSHIASLRTASGTLANPHRIRITKADGSGAQVELLTTSDLADGPRWSPDGTRVTYTTPTGTVRVEQADATGTGVDITPPAPYGVPRSPSFSPDGTRVAFSARTLSGPDRTDLFVGPASGGVATQLTTSDISNDQPDWKPAAGAGGGTTPVPAPTTPAAATPASPAAPGAPGAARPPRILNFTSFNRSVQTLSTLIRLPPVYVDCSPQQSQSFPPSKYCQFRGTGSAATAAGASASARSGARTVVVATGSLRVALGKRAAFRLKLTRAGRRAFKAGRRVRVTLTIEQRRGGVLAGTQSRTLTYVVPRGLRPR